MYDANGKRLNTRDVRKRQELEQFRHEKIQQLVKLNPNFKPPTDYRYLIAFFIDFLKFPTFILTLLGRLILNCTTRFGFLKMLILN